MYKAFKADTTVISKSCSKTIDISHSQNAGEHIALLYCVFFAHSLVRINWQFHLNFCNDSKMLWAL